MQHNLFSPFGHNPLQYPHFTKWDDKKAEVHLVTHPEITYTMIYRPAVVTHVQETRKAMGVHDVHFEPVYQRISIL